MNRALAAVLPIVAAVATVLVVSTSAQAGVRPIARWDVIPDQRMESVFKAGVVAFHYTGCKVEFRVNGTLTYTAMDPTYNDRSGVWEFTFPLDPANYPDGALTVDARAIPLSADHPSYDLPSLNLYANSGGSLTVNVVKWADSVYGSDSTGTGAETKPYATLAKAVQNTPSGGTVYLKAGSYSSASLGGGSSRSYWTTVSAAPGVARDDVEVGPGRPGTQRLKWTNLTIYCNNGSGGYTTILTGENGNHSVWLDNVKAWNKQGRWGADSTTFGNRYVAYITGGLTTEMMNGPGGGIIRGHMLDTIGSDAWSGGGRLVVNSACVGIDPGSTGAHPDFHQSYAAAPNYVQDVILYNTRGYLCKSQGFFGSRLMNAAFINCLFERTTDTVMYSQYSGELWNVNFININVINQTWLWRAGLEAHDVRVYNSVFGSMGIESGASTAGVEVDHCHFSSTSMGTNKTTGSTLYVDPATRDYRLQPTSPAYGTGRYFQCVPADIDGKLYNPASPNRGSYSSDWHPDPLAVDHWEIAGLWGIAGQRRFNVADGYVYSNVGGVTAFRAVMNHAIDPATVNAAAVTITGQLNGDLSSMVMSLSLEDDNRSLVIQLYDALPDADRYAITVTSQVKDASGQAVAGDAVLDIAYLAGDVNSSGQVSDDDVLAIRQHLGESLSDQNYRYDLDCSGDITGKDMQSARKKQGHALP